MSGSIFPRWTCLICRGCEPCIQSTDPGPEWEPKTDWGRDRKAERAAAAEAAP